MFLPLVGSRTAWCTRKKNKRIVRPHLEYCIQTWRPCRKKDIDILKKVQRRVTKIILKLRNISYEMHLKECGLTTLETRRLRRDQIEVFKIINIDRNISFSDKEERRTRGHGITLAKKQCRLYTKKISFSQRTVNEWNILSADCVGASSVYMFKNKIDIPKKDGVQLDRWVGLSKSQRASLSTCHLELIPRVAIWLNLVKVNNN